MSGRSAARCGAPPGGSAFSHRHRPFLLGYRGQLARGPRRPEQRRLDARALRRRAEILQGRHVPQFPGLAEEGEPLLRESFGASYARLQAVKAAYDPDNLFRSTFNITR
jgi:FAD/FMN-containing dehydrogenase